MDNFSKTFSFSLFIGAFLAFVLILGGLALATKPNADICPYEVKAGGTTYYCSNYSLDDCDVLTLDDYYSKRLIWSKHGRWLMLYGDYTIGLRKELEE